MRHEAAAIVAIGRQWCPKAGIERPAVFRGDRTVETAIVECATARDIRVPLPLEPLQEKDEGLRALAARMDPFNFI